MKNIQFTPDAFEEYNYWQLENKQIYTKLKKLVQEIARNPFEGSGKPEQLKYDYSNCWSRRITDEHRLIYQVSEDYVRIISCKFHYK
jgi:toxin YoeB